MTELLIRLRKFEQRQLTWSPAFPLAFRGLIIARADRLSGILPAPFPALSFERPPRCTMAEPQCNVLFARGHRCTAPVRT